MTLTIQFIEIEFQNTKTARCTKTFQFFETWQQACAHICDHLLTPPESHCWSILFQEEEFRKLINQDIGRFKRAKAMWETEGDVAQNIYDLYEKATESELITSHIQKWFTKQDRYHTCIAVGINGVIIVLTRTNHKNNDYVIRTSFIPMTFPNPPPRNEILYDPERRLKNPLPRQQNVDKDKLLKNMNKFDSEDEKIYYHIFKKMYKFVRKQYASSVRPYEDALGGNPEGRRIRYEDLKVCLPQRCPSFQEWQEIKARISVPDH